MPIEGTAEVFSDQRGRLTLLPLERIPFAPSRAYVLSELPPGARRGGHACRTQSRFLVGLSGSAMVTLDDGYDTDAIELTPALTLYVPPATWLEIEVSEPGVSILVFSDGEYDPDDYARDRSALPLTARPATRATVAATRAD